jgi:hypothetical protein
MGKKLLGLYFSVFSSLCVSVPLWFNDFLYVD